MRSSSELNGRHNYRGVKGWPSADGLQGLFANHMMLHERETFCVVNDHEKRKQRFPQVRDAELKNLNQ